MNKDQVVKNIAAKLKILRKLKGKSQSELGDILGVTFQQIQKYENGMNNISVGKLVELADALEVNVNYFFEDLEKHEQTFIEVFDFFKDSVNIELLIAFNGIKNERIRKRILQLVVSLEKEQDFSV